MKLVYPEQDVGLGTAYERLAIYRLFDRWLEGRHVQTAVDGPVDGMAGIAGVHLLGLARHGTRVRVELTEQAPLERVRGVYAHLGLADRLETAVQSADEPGRTSADLVLTYNALHLLDDWRGYLDRVAQRARRYLMVSVTSPYSYGVMIRKAMRVAERGAADELFDHPSTRPAEIEPALKRYGRIVEHDYLDCPWWPDLFVETGQSLWSGTLRRLPLVGRLGGGGETRPATEAGFLYGPLSFPLFSDHPQHHELADAMRRHPVFDDRGQRLARLFGHHHAYLVERA
ncbi:MAG: hypothetical protein ACRELB_20375 [Polyangiaceae bacterium]